MDLDKAFMEGIEQDQTCTFKIGTRAGDRSGYAVERRGHLVQLVKYGPERQTKYGPFGEVKTVIKERTIVV